jgi:glycosyltransferase involved in cell wall biosynthesis
MMLSILIPTIVGREDFYNSLVSALYKQYQGCDAEICHLKDNREASIGKKRNDLLELASGRYVVFIDDDDMVSDNYMKLLLEAAMTDCDCASLKGMYSIDGVDDGIFEHSLVYPEWKTTGNEVKYERFPNHINMIKASIAKQFKFPETNHGEDADWSTQIHKSGLLKHEHYIPDIIYYYRFKTNKK